MDDPDDNKYVSPLEGVTIESIQITLDLYRSGKAGVPLNTLWQFACPILDHYQLDLGIDPHTEVTSDNVDDMTLLLDVLETASMIWDYCSVEAEDKASAFESLTQNLLGHSPDQHETNQFIRLLNTMESFWSTLSKDPSHFGTNQKPCSDSSWHHDPPSQMTNGASFYGPDKLDIPDAFALFSRPLIESDAIVRDPDLLDDAMTRAQAYWDLAHLSTDQFEKHLDVLVSQIGPSPLSEATIREEALRMVRYFYTLFPERK